MMVQCHLNEHVWFSTDAEEAQLSDPFSLAGLQAGDLTEGRKFLLTSLYTNLRDTLGEDAEPAAFARVRPRSLREALSVRLADDVELRACKTRVSRVGVVADHVSRKVADQYDRNPYPRWTSLRRPGPDEERGRLSKFFDPSQLAFMDSPYEVLVAGCGTGHSSVYAALSSPNAQVTAVDLSISALGYGLKMAKRYDVHNIEFLQADIQHLSTHGMRFAARFQIIECVGVLHHMADAFGSWAKLLGCLAPAGIMLVGLYSATARHDVTALRANSASGSRLQRRCAAGLPTKPDDPRGWRTRKRAQGEPRLLYQQRIP